MIFRTFWREVLAWYKETIMIAEEYRVRQYEIFDATVWSMTSLTCKLCMCAMSQPTTTTLVKLRAFTILMNSMTSPSLYCLVVNEINRISGAYPVVMKGARASLRRLECRKRGGSLWARTAMMKKSQITSKHYLRYIYATFVHIICPVKRIYWNET